MIASQITLLQQTKASEEERLYHLKKITDEGFVEQASNSIFLSIALVILMTIRALSGFVSGYSMRWVSRKIVEEHVAAQTCSLSDSSHRRTGKF